MPQKTAVENGQRPRRIGQTREAEEDELAFKIGVERGDLPEREPEHALAGLRELSRAGVDGGACRTTSCAAAQTSRTSS